MNRIPCQRLRHCLHVLVALLSCLTVAASSSATATGIGPKIAVVAFYLESQPLSAALEAFAQRSNREILYDGSLTEGRQSAEVDGVYATETALEILLAGTGLEADIKDGGFFVVRSVSTSLPSGALRREATEQYYAVVQRALRIAFCEQPTDKRFAARLWIGRSGEVLQAKMLGMAGEPARAANGLLRMRIGPPPAHFAQPVTIVMQAGTFGREDNCIEARSRLGARAP